MPSTRSSARRRPDPMNSDWRFDAIGTAWSIGTPDPIAPGLRTAITARIDSFDRTWSRFRVGSAANALRTEREVDLGPDAPAILAVYDRLFALTAGAVSPLVGGALEQLGYGAGYTLTPSGDPPTSGLTAPAVSANRRS
ncbi:MAG: hypothetical protein EON52_04870 [Actinomycetales bacterium]|nr:MAG: hypothetical protein EON52_04870 [Actinomycetales bacterium]